MNWNTLWRASSIGLFLLLIAFSCTKIKSTDIGSELIPTVDNISTFDTTLDVITENFIFPDSSNPRVFFNTNGSTPDMFAGYISNDPQFGRTTATMYFLFSPNTFPFPYEVKDSLYLDSVVLTLRWNGAVNGDTNAIQKLNVFQVDQQIDADSAYALTDDIPYSRLLGSRTFAPSILNDSIPLRTGKVVNQLRIRLSDDFGNELLRLDTALGQPLSRDSLFRKYLRGFAVTPDIAGASAANALMGFNISDTNSHVRIYYRYDTAARKDTTFKTYRYTLSSGFANNIERNYTGSEFAATVAPGPDSIVYMQTTPGTYTVIRMPSLNRFKALKGNVLVHKAELSMQQIATTGQGDELFKAPAYLYIDYKDTVINRQRPFFQDAFLQGLYQPSLIGGIRKYVPGPSGTVISEYRFNIPRYVQGIITRNDINFPIYLYSPFAIRYNDLFIYDNVNPMASGRVKLGGGTKTGQKMVMRVIYSTL